MIQEELDRELLECARYGEDEDLRQLLAAGASVNYTDGGGSSALHKAAANGHTPCLVILKEYNAIYQKNMEGNTPAHWAALNGKADALKFIIDNFTIDVLEQNSRGRSIVTEAFQSKDEGCIELCLSHESAQEERLAKFSSDNNSQNEQSSSFQVNLDAMEEEGEELEIESSVEGASSSTGLTHAMQLWSEGPILSIRELSIAENDSINPLGGGHAEADRTGLSLWPASIILSRWAAVQGLTHKLFHILTVVELGCGGALPSITVAALPLDCAPKAVLATDLNELCLANAGHNLQLNQTLFTCPIDVTSLDWARPEARLGPGSVDVILAADLVYDTGAATLFASAAAFLLSTNNPNAVLMYVAPVTGRAGLDGLDEALAARGLILLERFEAPAWMFANPLIPTGEEGEDVGDKFVLHFYDLCAQEPHLCSRYGRSVTLAAEGTLDLVNSDESMITE